jgi:hypothetical protein
MEPESETDNSHPCLPELRMHGDMLSVFRIFSWHDAGRTLSVSLPDSVWPRSDFIEFPQKWFSAQRRYIRHKV